MSDSIVGKEYLPNVHIEKITYQEFESYQKAIVTVAMYDYEDQTWSLDEKFTQLWADDNSVETVVGLGDKEYRCKKGRRTLQLTLADHSSLLEAY